LKDAEIMSALRAALIDSALQWGRVLKDAEITIRARQLSRVACFNGAAS